MRAFFHGWRRKAGCIALMLACGLFGACLRSFVVEDAVSFAVEDRQYQVLSLCGNVCLWWWDRESQSPLVGWQQTVFEPGPFNSARAWGRMQAHQDLMDRLGLFRDGFTIPYSFAVLLLMIASAYLILWKPRRSI